MGRLKDWWIAEMEARGINTERDWYEEPPDVEPLLMLDQSRNFLHRVHNIAMTTDEIEFRYERRGVEFMLKSWHNGKERTMRGYEDTLPNWLMPIIDVARVSGHLRRTVQPPPDEILWFRTDKRLNLTTFIDLEPQ